MTYVDVMLVLFALGGSAFMLWSPPLRTSRTYTFLLVFATVLLGARSVLTPWWAFVVVTIASCSYLVVLFWFQHLLMGPSGAGIEFDRQLRSLTHAAEAALSDWRRAADRSDEAGIASARDRLGSRADEVLIGLARLDPPDDGWRQVVALEREYYEALRAYARAGSVGHPPADDVDLRQIIDLGRQLERAWGTARSGHAGRSDRTRSE
jgi:hypothetical protein